MNMYVSMYPNETIFRVISSWIVLAMVPMKKQRSLVLVVQIHWKKEPLENMWSNMSRYHLIHNCFPHTTLPPITRVDISPEISEIEGLGGFSK